MRSIIIAIDAGSSSIRATGYEYYGVQDRRNTSGELTHDQSGKSTQPTPTPLRSLVRQMEGIIHIIPMTSVIPNTGYIRIQEVMKAIDKCVDEVLRLLRQNVVPNSSYQVVAIGFSTFVMNLVGVDIHGDPVGELATLSYACNREEVVNECQNLIKNLGPEKLNAMYQRTGAPIHPAYATPQLLAFYNNEKNHSMIKQIEKWQTIPCTIIHRWCGKPHLQIPLSYSEASWTGMLDFRTCSWDDEVMDLLERCNDIVKGLNDDMIDDVFNDGIDLLPPLVDYDAALPFLRDGIPQYCGDGSKNSYWERWPEFRSRAMHLFLGVGDGAAANIGSKCGGYSSPGMSRNRIAVTIGTSAAARVCLPLPMQLDSSAYYRYGMKPAPPKNGPVSDIIVPPGLFCYRVDRDRVLLGGALTDGGSVVEWARSLFNLQSNEAFEACLIQVSKRYKEKCSLPPGPSSSSLSGITMIPFLSGERSTGFRVGARACVSGLTRDTTAADVMYACLESVILRVGCVLQLVRWAQQFEGSHGILVVSGNALEHNALWRQMLADCASMDVVVDGDSSEGTSRGVAIMMAGSMRQRKLGNPIATFNYGDEPLVVMHETKALPTVEGHWRAAMSTQESLIRAIAPTWSSA